MRLRLVGSILMCLVLAGCAGRRWIALSPAELAELGARRMEAGRYTRARDPLEKLRSEYPASPEAARAQILIADSFFAQKRYDEAAVEYRLFLDFHPASETADFALYRLGLCRFERHRGADRDLTSVRQALEEFGKLVRLYPDSEHVPQAQAKIGELERVLVRHDLHVARFYLKTRRWSGAVGRFEAVLAATKEPELAAEAEAGLALARPRQVEEDQRRAKWESERAAKLAEDAAADGGPPAEPAATPLATPQPEMPPALAEPTPEPVVGPSPAPSDPAP